MEPDDEPEIGTAPVRWIGRYRVLGRLGAGAMGEVVRARDERLGRDVAIKRMRSLLGGVAATLTARFEAEARALATLAHPGVVQVFDLGVDDDGDGGGEPYLVMELVDGPSLREVLRERGALPVAEVRAAGIQLARALEAAHARGVLHRDVKPANILLAPGGVWKLADFGLAHVPDSSVTLSGQFLGTPAYAAPEALAMGQFSAASDVFGLAATLYEAATGVAPRGEASLTQLLSGSDQPVLGPDAPPPPPELAGPLLAALAIDPRARPGAGGFAELLAAIIRPSAAVELPAVARPRWRWRRWAVIGAVVAAVALLVCVDGGRAPSRAPFAPVEGPGPADVAPPPPTTFEAPPDLDDKGARDWRKIGDRVRDGKYGDALHKLIDLERRHGASEQSTALRRWLEAAVAADGDAWRDD